MSDSCDEPNSAAKSPDCRRRNPHCHQSILTAAATLLEEKGYRGVSIEAIASRAGVGKQTIYRWWSCKAAVIMEAYADHAARSIPVPDTGSVQTDLIQILQHLFSVLTQTPAGAAMRGLIAESQNDTDVAIAFREQFVAQRRAITRDILQRGITRGEVRSDLDCEVAIDAIYGPVWYRLLLNHAPLNEPFARALIDQVIGGIGSEGVGGEE